VRLSLDGAAPDTLIVFTHDAISRPVATGTHVVFGSPRSGLDNLYALDLATRAVHQVSSRKLGASWPSVSPDGDRVAFSDYGIHGYDIAEMPLTRRAWTLKESARHRLDSPTRSCRRSRAGIPILGTTAWPARPFTGVAPV
jgi:hypothetical protein